MFTEGFAAGRELLMGVAHAVITPPMGSEMSGFIARHSGVIGIHDHLYARAMVWSNGNNATRAVLLTLDLIGLDLSTVDKSIQATRQRYSHRAEMPTFCRWGRRRFACLKTPCVSPTFRWREERVVDHAQTVACTRDSRNRTRGLHTCCGGVRALSLPSSHTWDRWPS